MSADTEKNKNIPDSMVSIGNKRLKEVRELAQTKFGSSLIMTSVNREEKRFDILVRDTAKEADVTDFETMWTMCKVEVFKPLPRKK